jgi:hypothetical protein
MCRVREARFAVRCQPDHRQQASRFLLAASTWSCVSAPAVWRGSGSLVVLTLNTR